jgi:DNA-binding transcriptional ArsR family regulator
LTLAERDEIATEMTLAALRAVADVTNYAILRALSRSEASLEELTAVSRLGRFATRERVSQLAAGGLTTRDPQSGHIRATRLAHGLVGLVERVKDRFAAKMARHEEQP